MNIKEVREGLGWSQKRLAFELGVSQRTVRYWEKGKRTPSEEKFEKLAKLKAEQDRKEEQAEQEQTESGTGTGLEKRNRKTSHLKTSQLRRLIKMRRFKMRHLKMSHLKM